MGVSAPPMRSNMVGDESSLMPSLERDAAGVCPVSSRKTSGALSLFFLDVLHFLGVLPSSRASVSSAAITS